MDALTRDRMLRMAGVTLPELRMDYVEPEDDDDEDLEDDLDEEEDFDEEDEPARRHRELELLGVELRARTNPAPGRQVITREGMKKYGLPMGATITPGMRRLTEAQQQAVEDLPEAERAKYQAARRQGSTHTKAMAAAKGTTAKQTAPRKAAPRKATPVKKATPATSWHALQSETSYDKARELLEGLSDDQLHDIWHDKLESKQAKLSSTGLSPNRNSREQYVNRILNSTVPAARKEGSPTKGLGDGKDRRAKLAGSAKSKVVESENLGGFRGGATRETHADGTVTIHKQFADNPDGGEFLQGERQADAEELASLVASAVGAKAPAVHRAGPDDIHMEFMAGKHIDHSPLSPWKDPPKEVADSDGGRLLGLMDLILGNPERHAGNFLVDDDGQPIALDNASTFGRHASSGVTSPFAAGFINEAGNDWATEHDISPADMAKIRTRLEALRPEFDRLGRSDWFDTMMENFEILEPRATGTRNRLGDDDKPSAKKATPDPAQIASSLSTAQSREEAQALLAGLSLPQLKAVADSSDIEYSSRVTKTALAKDLVFHVVGRRLDAQVISTPRKATPDLEQVAVSRQAEIDEKRKVSGALSEVEELLANDASDKALRHRLESMSRRRGTPDALREELLEAVPHPTGEGGLSSDPAVREVQVENRIREAYRRLIDDPERLERQRERIIEETGLTPITGYAGLAGAPDWVGLADIRDEVGDGISRDEVDAALKRMALVDTVASPMADQKILLQRDRDSAVQIGGQAKHAIHLDDPKPRPVPYDKAKLQQILDRVAADNGLTKTLAAGTPVRFDRRKHTPIDPNMADGAPALVVRPGFQIDRDGRKVAIEDTVVEEIDEADYRRRVGASARREQAALAAVGGQLSDRPGLSSMGEGPILDLDATLTFANPPDWANTSQHTAAARTLRLYRNSTYKKINPYLRAQANGEFVPDTFKVNDSADRSAKPTSESLNLHTVLMDDALAASPLTEPVELWRGIYNVDEVFPDGIGVGSEFDEPGFPSTSAKVGVAAMFGDDDAGGLMRLHVPAGVGAIRLSGWPDSNDRRNDEAEVLLQRNLRFRVTGDTIEQHGTYKAWQRRPDGSGEDLVEKPIMRRVLDVEVEVVPNADEAEEGQADSGPRTDDDGLPGQGSQAQEEGATTKDVAPAVDESVPLERDPEGDNMFMHGDSASMNLAQALARKGRNGTANRVMELRRKVSVRDGDGERMPVSEMLAELKGMRDRETDAELLRQFNRAVESIDAPARPIPDLPANTPPPARRLIEDLNEIPYARKRRGEPTAGGAFQDEQSFVEQVAAVYHDAAAGRRDEAGRSPVDRLRNILRNKVHESNDGSFQIWALSERLDDGSLRDPNTLPGSLRAWERGQLNVPAPESAAEPAAGWRSDQETRRSRVAELAKTEPTSVRELAGGHHAGAEEVTYPDASKTVRKTFEGAEGRLRSGLGEQEDAEELGSLVLAAVGLPSPAVARVAPNVIEMEFVDGQSGYDFVDADTLNVPVDIVSSDDGRLLGLADALMALGDRSNPSNWMRTRDGRLVGIDNEFAFFGDVARGNPFAAHFVDRAGRYRRNDLSPTDVAQIRARLQSLHRDFNRLGRADWHDAMMGRLDQIEANAKGKRDRLADTPSDSSAATGLDKLTVVQLKERLRQLGLPVSGRKADLIARLGGASATRDRVLAWETRAMGADVTPGHDQLHHYWTRGEGLAKWRLSPHPWTTLVGLLTEHVGPLKAKTFASRWFIEVFGYAAGSDLHRVHSGKPPRGDRIGPG